MDIFLEEPIVDIGDGLQQLLAILLRLFPVFLRDVLDLILGAECFVPVDDGFHIDEIDDSPEVVFLSERKLDRHRRCVQPIPHHLEDSGKISARPVHLVHETDARHAVLVRLPPDRLRLGLHALHRAKERHGAIEDA